MFRHERGCRTTIRQNERKSKQLESCAKDGESPVDDSGRQPSGILSIAGHEKSCEKQRGPSRKAKYSRETDSEPVL